jgi:hypothetical protein
MANHRAPTPPRLRRAIVATVLALSAAGLGTGIAAADPDFGPGNSSKGPQDPGAICHPPGQTADRPACK